MKKTIEKLGIIAFWLSWPVLYLVLQHRRRTRVLIVCGDKIVVVKSFLGNGKWGLPGGGIHKGEQSVKAMIREVKEEVGLDLDKSKCKKVSTKIYKENGLRFDYDLFLVKIKNKSKLTLQFFEIVEARWIAITQLDDTNSSIDVIEGTRYLNKL